MRKTNRNLSVIGAGIIALSAFAGCSKQVDKAETMYASSGDTSVSSDFITEQTTSEVSTESSSESTSFTVETNPYTNPFLNLDASEYSRMVLLFKEVCKQEIGFDNPAALQFLDDEYYKLTGEHNDSITLSDVGYFQYNSQLADAFGGSKFSEYIGSEGVPAFEMMFIRAFLIQENLQFGYNEIEWTTIAKRFPRFQYNKTTGESWRDDEIYSIVSSEKNREEAHTVTNPLDFSDSCMYDAIYYMSLIDYNGLRGNYMYNNPYGDKGSMSDEVIQKRDKYTGDNVLDFTDEQLQQMMDDVHQIPGCENMDITRVETREEFYASYGIYPEELLDMKYAWSGQFTSEEANKYVEEWTVKIERITKVN
ncbi:MAG: hypothetical protein J5750_01795 [Clostridiales bacterium]|nr:hypothetical protein [Clostridiales bacterium]